MVGKRKNSRHAPVVLRDALGRFSAHAPKHTKSLSAHRRKASSMKTASGIIRLYSDPHPRRKFATSGWRAIALPTVLQRQRSSSRSSPHLRRHRSSTSAHRHFSALAPGHVRSHSATRRRPKTSSMKTSAVIRVYSNPHPRRKFGTSGWRSIVLSTTTPSRRRRSRSPLRLKPTTHRPPPKTPTKHTRTHHPGYRHGDSTVRVIVPTIDSIKRVRKSLSSKHVTARRHSLLPKRHPTSPTKRRAPRK